MKRLLLPAIGAIALLGFAACSPDSTDFKSEGEDFIEDDDGDLAQNYGYTFADAACEKPDNTDEGTVYTCTAVDNEGDTWDFSVEITGERELTATGYSVKRLQPALLSDLQVGGTVDEACLDTELAALNQDEVKTLTDDYSSGEVSPASEAIFDGIATACVS